jgi:prepilin-type N-terminal cleavage/methylation domain-containing protein
MKKVMRRQAGFTLLEIIVVLAVLGALAAMLTPAVFRYIEDANRARVQNDTRVIAGAIQRMYADTGRWPFYASGTGKIAYAAATDAAILSSNGACVNAAAATLASCDDAEPEVGTSGYVATALADSLARQLITNTGVAYLTSGPRAWKGPYLEAIPALDAWGRSYLVNIDNADPDDATPEWVVVISAGPDGILDTVLTTLVTGNPSVGGDDVLSRVK